MLETRKLLHRHDKLRLTLRYVPKIGRINCYALKFAEFGKAVEFDQEDEITE